MERRKQYNEKQVEQDLYQYEMGIELGADVEAEKRNHQNEYDKEHSSQDFKINFNNNNQSNSQRNNQNQRNKADKYFFRHTFIPSFYFVDYPDNFAESPQPPSCR